MTDTARKHRPRWRRRAEDRPDEVLDAALDLFIERGFSPTRVEDIASRAGLSKGAVYLYFDSKEAILEALVRRAIVPIAQNAAALARSADGPPGAVIAAMVRAVAARLANPRLSAIPRLVIAEAGKFPNIARMYRNEVIDQALAALASVIARGVASGEFRDVDPQLAVRNIAGPIVVHMLLATVFEPGDEGGDSAIAMGRFIDSHLDILMNGLARQSLET